MRGHLLPAVVFLVSAQAAAAGARVESVELTTQADGREELRVTTDRPANFTSFKLSQPARVVVDFPETTGASTKGTSEAGLVRRWGAEQLGDDAAPVVRLIVELREDADYVLSTDGARVLLRLLPARGRPLVALDEKEREDARAVADRSKADAARLEAERVAREKAEFARLEADRVAREKAELARLETERVAREKAELARLETERVAREKAELARLEADRVAREKAELARLETERVAREKAEFARLEAERVAREKAERVRVEAARETAEAGARERAVVAALPVARVAPARAHGGSAALQQVSFRGAGGVARLVLRTSREVTFDVREEPGRVVLALDDTNIPLAANRLPLDTRFFGTAVTRVVPREDRAGRRTLLTLELSGPAQHEISRTDDGLVLVVEGPPARQPTVVAGEPDGW